MINADVSDEVKEKYYRKLKIVEKELDTVDIEYTLVEGGIKIELDSGLMHYGVTTEKWTFSPNITKGRGMSQMINFVMKSL